MLPYVLNQDYEAFQMSRAQLVRFAWVIWLVGYCCIYGQEENEKKVLFCNTILTLLYYIYCLNVLNRKIVHACFYYGQILQNKLTLLLHVNDK